MTGRREVQNTILRIYYHYSFWVKLLLSFFQVILTILTRTGTPTNLQHLLDLNTIFLASLLTIGFIPKLKYLIKMEREGPKNGEQVPLDNQSVILAQKMGLTITHYTFVENFNNASIYSDSLVIGDQILSILTSDELRAVIAHEFTHKQHEKKHLVITAIGATIISGLSIIIGYGLPVFRFIILFLSSFYLINFPFLWYRELDCDINATKYCPGSDLTSAYMKIGGEKFHVFSVLHPSWAFRIRNINARA